MTQSFLTIPAAWRTIARAFAERKNSEVFSLNNTGLCNAVGQLRWQKLISRGVRYDMHAQLRAMHPCADYWYSLGSKSAKLRMNAALFLAEMSQSGDI